MACRVDEGEFGKCCKGHHGVTRDNKGYRTVDSVTCKLICDCEKNSGGNDGGALTELTRNHTVGMQGDGSAIECEQNLGPKQVNDDHGGEDQEKSGMKATTSVPSEGLSEGEKATILFGIASIFVLSASVEFLVIAFLVCVYFYSQKLDESKQPEPVPEKKGKVRKEPQEPIDSNWSEGQDLPSRTAMSEPTSRRMKAHPPKTKSQKKRSTEVILKKRGRETFPKTPPLATKIQEKLSRPPKPKLRLPGKKPSEGGKIGASGSAAVRFGPIEKVPPSPTSPEATATSLSFATPNPIPVSETTVTVGVSLATEMTDQPVPLVVQAPVHESSSSESSSDTDEEDRVPKIVWTKPLGMP